MRAPCGSPPKTAQGGRRFTGAPEEPVGFNPAVKPGQALDPGRVGRGGFSARRAMACALSGAERRCGVWRRCGRGGADGPSEWNVPLTPR